MRSGATLWTCRQRAAGDLTTKRRYSYEARIVREKMVLNQRDACRTSWNRWMSAATRQAAPILWHFQVG